MQAACAPGCPVPEQTRYHAATLPPADPTMTIGPDRRQHERIKGPFDGSWDGAAGMRTCRITDLSASGCFIDAMGAPGVGTVLNIAIELDGRSFVIPSTVAYVDRIQGFAVRFNHTEQTSQLAAAVNARLGK
jgi:PilZ domain